MNWIKFIAGIVIVAWINGLWLLISDYIMEKKFKKECQEENLQKRKEQQQENAKRNT